LENVPQEFVNLLATLYENQVLGLEQVVRYLDLIKILQGDDRHAKIIRINVSSDGTNNPANRNDRERRFSDNGRKHSP
jgi:hypothetical protein